jgi:hypothetical protein
VDRGSEVLGATNNCKIESTHISAWGCEFNNEYRGITTLTRPGMVSDGSVVCGWRGEGDVSVKVVVGSHAFGRRFNVYIVTQ